MVNPLQIKVCWGGVVVLVLLLPPAIAILREDDTAQASVNMALNIIKSHYHLEQTQQKKIKIVAGGKKSNATTKPAMSLLKM